MALKLCTVAPSRIVSAPPTVATRGSVIAASRSLVWVDARLSKFSCSRPAALTRKYLRHRQEGSRRDGGSGSCRFTDRQAQARKEKLAMLRIPVGNDARHHGRGDLPESFDDLSRFAEPSHMRVACGKMAVRIGKTRVFLDGKDELRCSRVELPADEMRICNLV